MNEMTEREAFFAQLFACGKAKGVEAIEVCLEEKNSLSLTVSQGELDGFVLSEEITAGFRGVYKDKFGSAYSEQIVEGQAEQIILNLMESAELGSEANWQKACSSPKEIPTEFSKKVSGVEVSVQEKIDFALALEKHTKAADVKITKTDYCQYEEFQLVRQYRRSDGFQLKEFQQGSMAMVSAVAELAGEVRTASTHDLGSDLKFLSAEKIGSEAGVLAASSIGAKSVKSGKYPVILENLVAAAILEGFAPVFYGDRVLYQMSLLKDKIGDVVAKESVTIVDDPHMRGGGRTTYFDDEGVLTKPCVLVENGVLKTYLHNCKTALESKTQSTGNGFRANAKAGIEVFATNLRIEKGFKRLSDLQEQMGTGIVITDVQGTFAGINAVSGDFSLQASGFWIEAGTVTTPIGDVTISGNFYEVLQSIEGIANDLRFLFPYGPYVGAPSLLIRELSVAGE